MKKRPLLQILQELYPDTPRQTLYARVLCGEVLVNGERLRDPKCAVPPNIQITFGKKRYVSRGGEKLEYALERTDFAVEGKVVLDAGSSTGGFTDCLLQHGAAHVHAVDVGINQLAYRLRMDARISVHERTNIMRTASLVPAPDVAVADISFRSLKKAAARVIDLTLDKKALVLAKPQFEWPKDDSSFDGVLERMSDIRSVLTGLAQSLAAEGVYTHSVVPSPIAGRKGNREFFFLVDRVQTENWAATVRLIDEATKTLEGFS
ncbi:MAG: TlyA family RNA methyltransferase [Spirochaetales bacterium]|nr:TlyA family RNA methyltransferase [Spirochaetales bacterium]